MLPTEDGQELIELYKSKIEEMDEQYDESVKNDESLGEIRHLRDNLHFLRCELKLEEMKKMSNQII